MFEVVNVVKHVYMSNNDFYIIRRLYGEKRWGEQSAYDSFPKENTTPPTYNIQID